MKTTVNNLAFIVEDNEMFSKMLNHTLSNSGVCQFISFKSGEECISNLYMNPFLIIMDYGLPGIDGLKTFRTIKEYNPDIPVIVLTGTNDVKIGNDFLNDGAYAFLLKQKSTTHEVIKIINEILDNKGKNKKRHERNGSSWISKFLMITLFCVVAVATILTISFLGY